MFETILVTNDGVTFTWDGFAVIREEADGDSFFVGVVRTKSSAICAALNNLHRVI